MRTHLLSELIEDPRFALSTTAVGGRNRILDRRLVGLDQIDPTNIGFLFGWPIPPADHFNLIYR
jgi:hypothetical protein